jgi:hypothetical protein
LSKNPGFGKAPNAGDAVNLPQDFLGVAANRLAVSANRVRSMSDLQEGLRHLNDRFCVVDVVVSASERAWEDPEGISGRHIRRGAALAQLLLDESVPGFAPNSDKFFDGLVDLDPQPNPARDTFRVAKDQLVEARRSDMMSERWGLGPEETAHNREAFDQRVEAVLGAAGLAGAFDIAVANLTGPGLEEPTNPIHAKYGAALVAVGVGVVDS